MSSTRVSWLFGCWIAACGSPDAQPTSEVREVVQDDAPVDAQGAGGGVKAAPDAPDAAEPPATPGPTQPVVDAGAPPSTPAVGALGSHRGPPPTATCNVDDASRLACCVLVEVNDFRAEHSLVPYHFEPTLARAALDYAKSMANTGRFDHYDAEERGPAERLAKFGVVNVRAGENLHSNTFDDVMKACTTCVRGDPKLGGGWENSKAGHRELMLGVRPATGEPLGFTHAGVGAAWDGRAWFIDMYVAEF